MTVACATVPPRLHVSHFLHSQAVRQMLTCFFQAGFERMVEMKSPIQTVFYFQSDLRAYKTMMDLSEKHWEADLACYQKELKTGSAERSFGGRRDLFVHLKTEYPQIQRKALFIVLMTKLEDFLNQLSLSLQNCLNLNISFTDINGQGAERIKRYITKCTEIEFPSESDAWNAICDFQKIRNVIVHSDGHIDLEKQKKAYEAIRRRKNITIEKYARNHIILAPEFIPGVISELEVFAHNFSAQINTLTLRTKRRRQ